MKKIIMVLLVSVTSFFGMEKTKEPSWIIKINNNVQPKKMWMNCLAIEKGYNEINILLNQVKLVIEKNKEIKSLKYPNCFSIKLQTVDANKEKEQKRFSKNKAELLLDIKDVIKELDKKKNNLRDFADACSSFRYYEKEYEHNVDESFEKKINTFCDLYKDFEQLLDSIK